MSLLELHDVHAGYGPVEVLHGIDCEVNEGSIAVILGANGAGKTTTLRALSGMIPARGKIMFNGQDISGKAAEDVVRLGVAHVPQGRGTLPDLSVEDNLRLGAYVRKDKDIDADLERWYDFFPRLRERRKQPAGGMSGGEQQMLAVSRALMLRPKLLLLDEPSLGLAPIIIQNLFKILGEINQELGTTMLIVEQNANLALGIASYAYVLETGRIVGGGEAETIRNDESIRRSYLGY
jgi:branched-chain amino acid transport system ATP-binding protein